MNQAIQLYGYLILAFLGVVSPILLILLSIFREGTLKLTTQYESEKSKSEENIKGQITKKGKAKDMDLASIEQSLKELKAIKKTAEARLSYLNPRNQVLSLFIPLLVSFLGVILSFLASANVYYVVLFLIVSLIFFCYAVVASWKLLVIIIEVRKNIDDDRKDAGRKTIELLSTLVAQGKRQIKREAPYFLKEVYITWNDNNIEDKADEFTILTDNKQAIKIGIRNSESRMAKNIQIGFIFPLDFIIEKTGNYSIHIDKTNQVVRYEVSLIHGNTHFIPGPLAITPLKKGDYKIETFIKAENIESMYRDFNLKVA